MASQPIEIAKIRSDGGTQSRAAVDRDVVETYAEALRGGAVLPSVLLVFDGNSYWLADGFHRLGAARLAGRDTIEAEIRQGTQDDAVWISCGVNATHGLPRSNADKRRAVERALAHPRSNGLSDGLLAGHCGVSDRFVGKLRAEVNEPTTQLGTVPSCEQPASPPPRAGIDGRVRDTSGISEANRQRAGGGRKVDEATRLEEAIGQANDAAELEALWGEVANGLARGTISADKQGRLDRATKARARELRDLAAVRAPGEPTAAPAPRDGSHVDAVVPLMRERLEELLTQLQPAKAAAASAVREADGLEESYRTTRDQPALSEKWRTELRTLCELIGEVESKIKGLLPAGPCPLCRATGCSYCGKSGWLTLAQMDRRVTVAGGEAGTT